MDFDTFWNPLLYIDNILSETKEATWLTATVNHKGEAYILERRRIRGVFLENLELNDFPLDVQVCVGVYFLLLDCWWPVKEILSMHSAVFPVPLCIACGVKAYHILDGKQTLNRLGLIRKIGNVHWPDFRSILKSKYYFRQSLLNSLDTILLRLQNGVYSRKVKCNLS